MLGWLKTRAPLQGSVWFPDAKAPRPEALPIFADPRVARGEPEWNEDGTWRMTTTHPHWGALTIRSAAVAGESIPALLAPYHALSEAEAAAMPTLRSALHLEMQPIGDNVLRERKTMLRALSAIGGAGAVVAVDHLTQRLWTAADLSDELAHDADLDVEGVYALHAVLEGDGSTENWLHTHGLAELGGFDFHIVQPHPDWECNARKEASRALAGMILEGRAKPNGVTFPLLGHADACFIPLAEFLSKADGHASTILKSCVDGDELHGAIAAVLCNPSDTGILDRLFGRRARPNAHDALWFLEGADATVIFTDGMTALTAARAAATYGVLRRLAAEFEPFAFPIGVKLAYETDRGGREHLWFRPQALGDETIDATLESDPFNIPGMKPGDRGVHPLGRLTDWTIGTPVGPITPRSQAAARIVREHPDEVRDEMKAGWPQWRQ